MLWHPAGEGNSVADKGDNAYTRDKYRKTSPEYSKKMLAEKGYTIDYQGILNLNECDVFEVDDGRTAQNKEDLGKNGHFIRNQASTGIKCIVCLVWALLLLLSSCSHKNGIAEIVGHEVSDKIHLEKTEKFESFDIKNFAREDNCFDIVDIFLLNR